MLFKGGLLKRGEEECRMLVRIFAVAQILYLAQGQNFVIAWIVFDSQFRAESLVYCRIIGRCHFEGFKSQFLLEFKCKLLFLLKLFKHTRIVGYVGNNRDVVIILCACAYE